MGREDTGTLELHACMRGNTYMKLIMSKIM